MALVGETAAISIPSIEKFFDLVSDNGLPDNVVHAPPGQILAWNQLSSTGPNQVRANRQLPDDAPRFPVWPAADEKAGGIRLFSDTNNRLLGPGSGEKLAEAAMLPSVQLPAPLQSGVTVSQHVTPTRLEVNSTGTGPAAFR